VIYSVWIVSDQTEGSVIEPFAVGSEVTWPIVSKFGDDEYLMPFIGEEEVARITHAVDGYFALQPVEGTVMTIRKLFGKYGLRDNGVMGRPIPGSGRFFTDNKAVRWEEEKEEEGLAFIGYMVDLEVP